MEHINSPVIQSEDFYPFGLTFNSYSRENSTKSKFLYNQGTGETAFKTERVVDLDLNVDQSFYRTYDFATGRWWQVDPKMDQESQESFSPYNYSFNNPIRYNDPKGDCPWCIGAAVGAVLGASINAYQQYKEGTLDFSTGKTWARLGAAGVGGGLAGSGLGGVVGGALIAGAGEASDQLIADGQVTNVTNVVINAGAAGGTGLVLKGVEALAVKTGLVSVVKSEVNALGKTTFVSGAKGLPNSGHTATTGRALEDSAVKVTKGAVEATNGVVSYAAAKAATNLTTPDAKPEEQIKSKEKKEVVQQSSIQR